MKTTQSQRKQFLQLFSTMYSNPVPKFKFIGIMLLHSYIAGASLNGFAISPDTISYIVFTEISPV